MSKFLPVSLFFLVISISCLAQKAELLTDERGKYIYYEVVALKDITKEVLLSRAAAFVKTENKGSMKLEAGTADTLLNASGQFLIYKKTFGSARPAGQISYTFKAGLKDGKYRFWLTDYIFIPYTRDRYANFVPATTIGTPLEDSPGKLGASEWKEYIAATTLRSKELAGRFKKHMESQAPQKTPTAEPKKIDTKNW